MVNQREKGIAQAQPPADPGHILECLQQQQQSCLGWTNLPAHSLAAGALDVPGQGKQRSQGFRSHKGRNSSRNNKGVGSSWELQEALGSSRHGPGTNPARRAPAGPNFPGTASRVPCKALWEQREQQSWRCCCSPLHCHVSQEQQSVPGLCSALLPLLQRTVSICFGSALEAAPGSSSDETCLGKPLPWEGWGYPAQAALMYKQLE